MEGERRKAACEKIRTKKSKQRKGIKRITDVSCERGGKKDIPGRTAYMKYP